MQKQQFKDPEAQQVRHKESLKQYWKLTCPQGRVIKQTCFELNCNKTSLHCNDPECSHCFGLHPFCKTLPIQNFSNFLIQNYYNQLHLFEISLKVEQEMIRSLKASQQQLKKQLHYMGLPGSIRSVLLDIFQNNSFKKLTGMDLHSLKDEIQKFRPMNKEKLILEHSNKAQSALTAYLVEKMQIMTSLQANQRIISKILTKEDDVDFVFEALGHPKKLQLLYRGSQNQFSAAKFHQKCDQIEHTLTVVRTEFDRVIAGYTPLKWSSPSAWTTFCDNSGRSFLLQVNLRQKMALAELPYAIYCYQMHGPRFGRSDLAIPNKCNQNNCTGNFPASYSMPGRFANGQQSYTAFSGSPSGFLFRAIEYEVFKVIF